MSDNGIEIITYGGGYLLHKVFIAISMLFYGNGGNGFIQPLCVIGAMIGGAWGISKLFFQSYTDALITKYFLPLLAIPAILLVPHARIHVIDKLDNSIRPIDKVPLFFAKIIGLSSELGYQMTLAIETVMHTPNDVKYCKTGMIFGADNALDFTKLRLNNGTLSQNLHQFTQQCIIYDVALGRYSIDQMRTSTDLFKFLMANTSNVRMIQYYDPEDRQGNKAEFLTCTVSGNGSTSFHF